MQVKERAVFVRGSLRPLMSLAAISVLGAISACSGACAEKGGPGPSAPSTSAAQSASAPVSSAVVTNDEKDASADAAPTPKERDWVEAMRLESWREAAQKIDAITGSERDRPEIKYARARAALAMGDPTKARDLLTGLDAALPALARDIQRYRAEACAEVGPFAEAVAFFSRSPYAGDLVRAADLLERTGDAAGARRMVERAVTLAQKRRSKSVEAKARTVRARLAKGGPTGAAAVADLRWIATVGAATEEGRAARETLDKLKVQLTSKEVQVRVDALVDAARADEAVAELEGAGGTVLKPPVRLHLHAMSLYRARRYADAATAFEKAIKTGTGFEAEEMHYWGRALSRIGKNTDAIKKFRESARRYRRTPWGDRSAFLAAQLLAQTGKYKEAAKEYTAYLGAFPHGERRDDAEYERALALLSGESPLSARQIFKKLAAHSKPDDAARLMELEGVAAYRGGQKEIAIRIWNKVLHDAPLSWASAMARARLAEAGETLPPVMDPPPSAVRAPVDAQLPGPAALLASVGLDADAEHWLSANEQSSAQVYPGHESEALCSMYSKLARGRRRYKVGAAAVSYATLMRTPSPSERWAWNCVYPNPYVDHVRSTEAERNLPFGLIHAVMRQESVFDPAIASPAGAVGLMQIIPPTASAIAREIEPEGTGPGELSNPEVSIRYGGFYLGKLLAMLGGSVPLTAAAYNAGPIAVSQWLAGAVDSDSDVWVARIPYGETRTYVARVTGNLLRYQWLSGGNDKVVSFPLKLPDNVSVPDDAY